VPTIINKITTNTVEIASIRIYARALQSLVEIARLGPAARNDALTIRTANPLPIVRSDQGAEASRGPPAAFPSGSGSRVTLTAIRRASSFVSIFARRASASLPRELDVCERLPVGVVNPVRRPAAMRNISEWMEHVIARAARRSAQWLR
jgi:hypothetical protein